jgi:hypothetical protein
MIERGTKNMSATPFVFPTWNRMKDGTRQAIIADLKKLIKRIRNT